jgi:hypothetical protein
MPLTREHVLSEKNFGGRLIAPDTICKQCNSLAGRVEALVSEHPFVSEAIAKFMVYPGGKRYPQSKAVLADGAHVQVERRHNGTEIIAVRPQQIDIDPDGTEVWQVADGREREFEERRAKQGQCVRAVGHSLGPAGPAELHYGLGAHNFAAWARFVAKTALATMSLVTNESWLDTDGAEALQNLFHERPQRNSPGYALPLYPEEQDRTKRPWASLGAGEHLLGLWHHPSAGQWRFTLVLFGYLAAEVELKDIECPEDEPTWLVPCTGLEPTRMSAADFDRLFIAGVD